MPDHKELYAHDVFCSERTLCIRVIKDDEGKIRGREFFYIKQIGYLDHTFL